MINEKGQMHSDCVLLLGEIGVMASSLMTVDI